ncbi:MAG TPA: SRPBCC family protein [Micromonosporaceae bacterium]
MVHSEYAVTIDRPTADVFAYLADATNDRLWRDGVVSIERTSETAELGATYRQTIRGPGGSQLPGDFAITEYQPNDALSFEVAAGPVRPTGRYLLTADGPDRTSVTFTLDVTPTGAMRLMSSMIAKEMDAEVKQLDHLKATLEAA